LRTSFASGADREYFANIDAKADPTPTLPGTSAWTLGSPNKDGGVVVTQTAGSGKSNIFIVLPKYQFVTTFAYQWKYGVNFGLNYLLRQGYATPYFNSNADITADPTLASGGRNVVVVSDVDSYRLPTVHSFDGRVSKALNYKNYNASIDFDVFNMFNNATTLGRQYDLDATNFDKTLEIMNPRIWRIGFRFSFK